MLGADGQVGWALRRALAVVGRVTPVTRSGREARQADLSDTVGLSSLVRDQQPDVIVNAAAYTAVDKAEAEPDLAWRINAEAVGVLAGAVKEIDALLVHYSTDYVFDGSGTEPWTEDAATAPVNQYGRSKLGGEKAIQESGVSHLTFRTSWVYAAHGHNFLKTMIRLAREREALKVVNDQFGVPAGADFIADVTAHAIRHVVDHSGALGLYHLTPSGETTWYGYARYAIQRARELGLSVKVADSAIEPVGTEAFPTPAARPANSRLDGKKLETTFGLHRPDWREGVDLVLREWARDNDK